MKPVKVTKQIDIVCWDCGIVLHRHTSYPAACKCMERQATPLRPKLGATEMLARNADMFAAIVGGATYQSVATDFAVSTETIRRVVMQLRRRMANPALLAGDIIPDDRDFLSGLRTHRDFWLSQLQKWRKASGIGGAE